MTKQVCDWCGVSFSARRTGGKPQRYCSPFCRRNFDSAIRAYGILKLEMGEASIADLKAASTTRALALKAENVALTQDADEEAFDESGPSQAVLGCDGVGGSVSVRNQTRMTRA